jgi:hypothetical protein
MSCCNSKVRGIFHLGRHAKVTHSPAAKHTCGPWQQRRLMGRDMFRQRRLSQQRSIRTQDPQERPATAMLRQAVPCRGRGEWRALTGGGGVRKSSQRLCSSGPSNMVIGQRAQSEAIRRSQERPGGVRWCSAATLERHPFMRMTGRAPDCCTPRRATGGEHGGEQRQAA